MVIMIPICLIETLGPSDKHRWQNWNSSNNLQMNVVAFGSLRIFHASDTLEIHWSGIDIESIQFNRFLYTKKFLILEKLITELAI